MRREERKKGKERRGMSGEKRRGEEGGVERK